MTKGVMGNFGIAAASLLLFFLSFGSGWSEAVAAEKLRVGFPTTAAQNWPLFVAAEKRLYEAEGLAVENVYIAAGAAREIQILLAGDIDFAVAGTITPLLAYLQGAPVVMVTGMVSRSLFQIYAVPEIRSLRDLKGTTIGGGRPGDIPHFAASAVLRAEGLDKTVNQLFVAGAQLRLLGMEKRQLHAAVLTPPFSFRAIEMGFKKLADAGDYIQDDQFNGVTTTRALVQKEPEKVKKFVSAVARGLRFITSNREESIKVLEKYTKQPRSTLEKTYDFIVPKLSAKINMKGIESINKYLVDVGMVTAGRDLKEFVDLRFLSRDR